MTRFGLLAALLLSIGCGSSITEALLTISASGLRVGVDVVQLHLVATDNSAGFTGFEQTLLLCPDDGTTVPGCRSLPLSVVLYPGPTRANDAVRVLVEGLREGVVLSSSAVITFTPGERQRLDFVLYGSCLNHLECSAIDSVCDSQGHCSRLSPKPDADLSAGMPDPQMDLATAPDDLATNPTCGVEGLACCGAPPTASCGGGSACYNGKCLPCGTLDALCCSTAASLCGAGLGCDSTFRCKTCGAAGEPCCTGDACTSGSCVFGVCEPPGCGAIGQPCCADGQCARGVTCTGNACVLTDCDTNGATCCSGAPSYCATGYYCSNAACLQCGGLGDEACLGATRCHAGYTPDPFAAACGLCNLAYSGCCGGDDGVCANGFTCKMTAGAWYCQ